MFIRTSSLFYFLAKRVHASRAMKAGSRCFFFSCLWAQKCPGRLADQSKTKQKLLIIVGKKPMENSDTVCCSTNSLIGRLACLLWVLKCVCVCVVVYACVCVCLKCFLCKSPPYKVLSSSAVLHADAFVSRCFCGEKTQTQGVRPIRVRDCRLSAFVEKRPTVNIQHR